MTDCERRVTDLLIGIARASGVFLEAALRLQGEPGWSNVTHGLHPSEFNRHLADANVQLALQGVLRGDLDDGGEAEWQLEVLRSGESGWVVERSLYLWLPGVEAPSRKDLPNASCSESSDLASRLPQLVEEFLTLRPDAPPE